MWTDRTPTIPESVHELSTTRCPFHTPDLSKRTIRVHAKRLLRWRAFRDSILFSVPDPASVTNLVSPDPKCKYGGKEEAQRFPYQLYNQSVVSRSGFGPWLSSNRGFFSTWKSSSFALCMVEKCPWSRGVVGLRLGLLTPTHFRRPLTISKPDLDNVRSTYYLLSTASKRGHQIGGLFFFSTLRRRL